MDNQMENKTEHETGIMEGSWGIRVSKAKMAPFRESLCKDSNI